MQISSIGRGVSEADEPPLRLLIGSDAADIAAGVARRQAAEDARWDDASTTDWQNVGTLATSYDRHHQN